MKHQLTLLSIAPEVAGYMEVSPAMSRSFEFSREGNSRFWTLRLAHSITDFLLSYLSKGNACACAVAFEQVQHADPLDREFIAVLCARPIQRNSCFAYTPQVRRWTSRCYMR